MPWSTDLMNSMGMNVTPVYGQQAPGGYTPQDAGIINAAIERQREIVDREYELRKQQAKQVYQAALMNARTSRDVAEANDRYQKAQTEIAHDRLAFDRDNAAQQLAFNREQLGENRRQFDQTFGLNQARLGYDLIGTAAQLRGPANYYQASEYSRGVSSMPQTSTFLSALQGNSRLADFGAQGGLPERETLGTLTAKLGGGTGLQNGAPSEAATLAQIGNIAAKGPHQLGAGSLEQLTPTEYGLFTSGLDRLGIDKDTFLAQYGRSRIGQGISGSGYQAA